MEPIRGVIMSSAKNRASLRDRPKRPAVPPLPTFEALDATHREVMRTLERLQQWVEQMDAEGIAPGTRALADDICRFFDGSARAHHAAEEQFVFPSLLSSGDAALVQHVHRLQQDHGWLEEDWLELQPQLRAVVEGYNGYDLDFLRAAVPVFTDLYRDHIALEENIVYPESRRRQA
jgi:hemerythrin-like domain-containing protein